MSEFGYLRKNTICGQMDWEMISRFKEIKLSRDFHTSIGRQHRTKETVKTIKYGHTDAERIIRTVVNTMTSKFIHERELQTTSKEWVRTFHLLHTVLWRVFLVCMSVCAQLLSCGSGLLVLPLLLVYYFSLSHT